MKLKIEHTDEQLFAVPPDGGPRLIDMLCDEYARGSSMRTLAQGWGIGTERIRNLLAAEGALVVAKPGFAVCRKCRLQKPYTEFRGIGPTRKNAARATCIACLIKSGKMKPPTSTRKLDQLTLKSLEALLVEHNKLVRRHELSLEAVTSLRDTLAREVDRLAARLDTDSSAVT